MIKLGLRNKYNASSNENSNTSLCNLSSQTIVHSILSKDYATFFHSSCYMTQNAIFAIIKQLEKSQNNNKKPSIV